MQQSWIAASLSALFALAACGDGPPETDLIADLERLAAAGEAEATYHLGMAHLIGAGVPRNPERALSAFREAAAKGDVLAAYKLGCFYDGQGEGLVADDATLALRYKLPAAQAGYALAQQDVGGLYVRRGDSAAALSWVEKAAAQGWPNALVALAYMYNAAPGVPRDPAKVAAYFRLYLDTTEPSRQQAAWLADIMATLSPAERERMWQIHAEFRPRPTVLTVSALSGQEAAAALVARHDDGRRP